MPPINLAQHIKPFFPLLFSSSSSSSFYIGNFFLADGKSFTITQINHRDLQVSPLLDGSAREWLRNNTRPLVKQ
jgi:hypothetical protein